MVNTVFFAKEGSKGLNETSATKLAAIASNLKTNMEARLENLSFLNVQLDIVGSNGTRIDSEYGSKVELLKEIKSMSLKCGELNGFIAWLRESQKAIEDIRLKYQTMTSKDEWLKESGKSEPILPDEPRLPEKYSMGDAIEWLSIKDRANYLALEAKASQLGKLIHPDGVFSKARKDMWKYVSKPTVVTGSGRDTIIKYYSPSISPEEVDSEFNELQKLYQSYESSLNHIKSEMRKMIEKRNAEERDRWNSEWNEFQIQREKILEQKVELNEEFHAWLESKRLEVSKIKISIPEMYEDLLKELYNVGSETE